MHSLLLQSLFPLLSITSFLSINVELSLSQDDLQYANCSEDIDCGGIGGISYPFWGVNRANYCGLPGFEVKCVNDAPMINMSNINYRILKTNSSAPFVTVARQDYWRTICPQTYVNTNINFSLFNYSSGLTNLTFYYACNTSITIPGLGDNFTSQVCSTNNGNITVWSFTQSPPVDPVAARACTTGISVPVFTTAAQALMASQKTIQEVVDEGFELGLEIDNVQCNNCSESGGKCGLNTISGGFSCFCQDQAYATTCNAKGLAVGGFSVMVIILYIICISRKRMVSFLKKDKRDEFDVEAFIRNYGSLTPKRYTYRNVKKMTDSFRDKIGKGGYGIVYKGRLPDGLLVAVKVLSESKGNGGEDFINEVASIGRTSHVNIVTLSGFCYEGDKRALIYEYMPNGSLDNFIHKHGSGMANFRLEWKTLSEIAVGIARGLEYLHRGCNTRILHFDIKPQNILLDKDFRPKISDFGLAKLCKTKDSIVSMMGTRGTAGYIAPEVFSRNFGGVSHKSDVYSYGMLVLEMVGAKNNLDSGVSHSSEMFPHYVYKDLELEKDENAFGAITEEEKEIGRKMVLISLWCIQTIPSDRPSMSKVVEMLEGPLHSLRIAPKPFLFPTIAAEDSMTTTSGRSTMGSMVSDGPMAALEMASRSHIGLGSHGRQPHGEEDMQAVREKTEGGRREREREEEEEDND
ncbi:PREDICTED: LEAF RUST 10 DISEASE-RESISTANCE [Prunus dulcis]|uniref:non-specific serine/threonine protein kinase n=1 Tax=Prunus dulcis TaxID=3755 RepID=A0A5E4FM35_PRUDU|nr:PREDICTED: LEAF RUST 10 DISEASE-RESISTANCE [Prunus dulcis]